MTPVHGKTLKGAALTSQVAERGTSAAQQQYLVGVPRLHQQALERTFLGTVSPRRAIKVKCLDCCNYIREEVKHCSVTICPLHFYRPYQEEDDNELESSGSGEDSDSEVS